MGNDKVKNKGILCMVVCALLWSTGGVLIKVVPWHPIIISGIRSLIAAIMIWFALRHEGCVKPIINKNTLLTAFFLSITMMLFVVANKLTTAANTIVLQSANPVFVLLFCYIFYKQKVAKTDLIAVIVIILGIALFFFDELSPGSLLGNMLALCCAMSLGLMFVSATKAETLAETLSGVFVGHCLAATYGLPFFILHTPKWEILSVGAILFLGIFQLGIPYILFSYGARSCSPLAISMIGMLEPIFNPILVALFVKEVPGKLAFVGGGIVLLTLFVWGIYNSKKIEKENIVLE